MPSIRAAVSAAALSALAGLAAGCGGSHVNTANIPTSAQTVQPSTATPAPPAGGPETRLGQKPAVKKPSGAPPKTLKVIDIVKGHGRAAKKGDKVTVQYVGIAWSTGREFDASWDHGQPFPFKLGAGMVIPGWDRGVVGMKVGGRRKLIIPPQLAYGAQGQPPTIGPSETLVFDVDLLKAG